MANMAKNLKLDNSAFLASYLYAEEVPMKKEEKIGSAYTNISSGSV